MQQKIIPIGNSVGVIIPKELIDKIGLQVGSEVFIDKDPHGTSILIHKDKDALKSSLTPGFLKIVNNIHLKYGNALQELAKIQNE